MRASAANVSEVFVSFQGEGPHAGRRHLFVRFAGCPLRCRYCDTPESLVPVETCRVLGPDGAHRLPNPLDAATLTREVRALAASARTSRVSVAGSSGFGRRCAPSGPSTRHVSTGTRLSGVSQ